MKKVAFYTLGCKVNQYETDSMRAMFVNVGFDVVEFSESADVYVINTCTVTAMGDKKSRQVISSAKKTNPNATVIVTGCMAQNTISEGKQIEYADLVVGNAERKNIINLLEEYEETHNKIFVSDIKKEKDFWETDGVISEERTRAYIKIQDGCDRFCSYCIIPYVRGRVRSRKPEEVVKEAVKMAKQGFHEIVLIGIHLASYGKDLDNISLIDILERLNAENEIQRIRLGSLEPLFITYETISRLAKLEKVCQHFHLSLQSGCDSVLKRMNRRYTTAEFEDKVNLIRKSFPFASLTTDIIVGFPGETDLEFETTYEYLKKIKLNKLHVFPYSKREGTVAAKMPDQVSRLVKKERAEKLIELSAKYEKEFAEKFIGKEVEILLEDRKRDEYTEGYTKEYVNVCVKGGRRGELLMMRGKKVLADGTLVVE